MARFSSIAVVAIASILTGVDAMPQGYSHGSPNWPSWNPSQSEPAYPTQTSSLPASYTAVSTATSTATSTAISTAASTAVSTAHSVYPVGTGTGTGYPRPTGASPYPTNGSTTMPDIVRGVNLGGWLVLESWMTPDLFDGTNAVDQWTFDSTDGAEAKLHRHWDSYITEVDIKKIASHGINSLRIPIGYWAYDNAGTPYIQGADTYLEKAIGWAREAGLKVLVDCHGSPGSQNGFDNSGREGNVEWQSDDNLQKSISVLKTISQKYGAKEYADVVYAIELVNEPISWDQNNFATTQSWAKKAYHAVKAAATNEHLQVIMHDGFMGPSDWTSVGSSINGDAKLKSAPFAIDVHLYQNQEASDSTLTQAQHVAAACNWTNSELLPSSSNLPVYVGEFSAQTNICANPDGSTTAGSSCSISGCQCSATVDIQDWQQPLVDATRQFAEAQMETFEHGSRGWFIWAYKAPGAWGLDNLIRYGALGERVTDRKYPNQCGS